MTEQGDWPTIEYRRNGGEWKTIFARPTSVVMQALTNQPNVVYSDGFGNEYRNLAG